MHKIGAYIVPTFIIYVHLIFIYISYYTDTSYMYMYDIFFFAYTYIYIFSHFLLSIFFGEESLYSPIFKKKRTEVATSESTKADGPGFAGAQPWLHDAVPPCHLKTLQLRSRDHAVGEPRLA